MLALRLVLLNKINDERHSNRGRDSNRVIAVEHRKAQTRELERGWLLAEKPEMLESLNVFERTFKVEEKRETNIPKSRLMLYKEQ